jgi:uncharacterized membrane protein AbrB (regulator of aidB expression)
VSAWLRRSLYSSFGLLWLTGSAWLVLHFFFQGVTDFGPAPHPWEPRLVVMHGVLAVVAVFFFGWIAGAHISEHWKRGLRRVSGIALVVLIALLALTGLASYYVTFEPLRHGSSLLHEIAGALALVPALIHWIAKR